MQLKLISSALLDEYLLGVPKGLQQAFDTLIDAELSTPSFRVYISVASVFSSKIEGEAIELDSYIKHKRDGVPFLPDYTQKIAINTDFGKKCSTLNRLVNGIISYFIAQGLYEPGFPGHPALEYSQNKLHHPTLTI